MEPKKLPTVKANAIPVRDQPISSPMGFTQMLSTAPYIGAEANELMLFDRAKIFSSDQGWSPVLHRLFPGGLMLLDSSIRDFVQDDLRGSTTDDLADVAYHFGSFYTLAAGLGATYVGGELIGDRRLQETGLLGGQSLLFAGVLGIGVKWVTQRDRPNSGKGAGSWSPFSFDEDNTSFPSGHALHAFAVASVVASEYEDTELVGPIAYGLATSTSLSRLNDNKHWASDVFIGGALGYFIGKLVVRHNPFDLGPGVAIGPWSQDDGQGLSLGFDF